MLGNNAINSGSSYNQIHNRPSNSPGNSLFNSNVNQATFTNSNYLNNTKLKVNFVNNANRNNSTNPKGKLGGVSLLGHRSVELVRKDHTKPPSKFMHLNSGSTMN